MIQKPLFSSAVGSISVLDCEGVIKSKLQGMLGAPEERVSLEF